MLTRLRIICLGLLCLLRLLRLLRLLDREDLLLLHVLRLSMGYTLLEVHLHSYWSHVGVSLHGGQMSRTHSLGAIWH